MKLRSLFLALTGALILMAFIAPRANATLIVYFNFEDQAPPPSSPPPFNPGFDGVADTIAADGFGGQQNSLLTMNGYTITDFGTGPALAIAGTNRAPGDTDQTNNSALVMNRTSKNNGAYLQFNVNTINLQDLSLSFAVDNNGNGFNHAQLSYSSTGAPGTFTDVGSAITITNSANTIVSTGTFNIPLADQSATGVFRLTFSGGQSNGNNRETAIDNIQLGATVVPEPATVLGGLLGLCGLCWHQRRRIRLILPRCGFRGLRRA